MQDAPPTPLVRPARPGTGRFGITASKKVGNAVTRNRMKRRFRALAREVIPATGFAGCDHVMIGRSAGIERDYGLLRQDLTRALQRVAM